MHDQPLLRMSLPSIPSFVLSGLLLLCLPFSSFACATTSHISFSYAARQ
ncbi:C40 family peptidase, partial [Shigella sonnei]